MCGKAVGARSDSHGLADPGVQASLATGALEHLLADGLLLIFVAGKTSGAPGLRQLRRLFICPNRTYRAQESALSREFCSPFAGRPAPHGDLQERVCAAHLHP
jgi:hypothetical protein